MHIWGFFFVSLVDDNEVDWNLESEMRQDGRIREVETHQESQTIPWGNVTPSLPEFNPHGKLSMAMRLHGDRDSGFSCCSSQARVVGFDRLYIHRDSDCRKLWQSQAFSLQRSTGERFVFVAEKQPGEGYFNLYNWVILSVTLMCHKAVFHVFSPPSFSHSSQACCKWIPHVARAWEKEPSDLVSHPTAVWGSWQPSRPSLTGSHTALPPARAHDAVPWECLGIWTWLQLPFPGNKHSLHKRCLPEWPR